MGEKVYLLKCEDQSYYAGHTDNLENRLMQYQHKMFPACYTATRLSVELVFLQEFATRAEALVSERQIKGWSRKKKEALLGVIGINCQFMHKDIKDLIKVALRDGAIAPPQGERLEFCHVQSLSLYECRLPAAI